MFPGFPVLVAGAPLKKAATHCCAEWRHMSFAMFIYYAAPSLGLEHCPKPRTRASLICWQPCDPTVPAGVPESCLFGRWPAFGIKDETSSAVVAADAFFGQVCSEMLRLLVETTNKPLVRFPFDCRENTEMWFLYCIARRVEARSHKFICPFQLFEEFPLRHGIKRDNIVSGSHSANHQKWHSHLQTLPQRLDPEHLCWTRN